MDNPLTGNDIKQLFNNKIKIITYEELTHYNNIDELLHPYNRVCILYVWKKDPNPYGHWICCFRNVNNNIEVFDPFGNFVDDFLNTIPKNFRIENNEYYKQLSHLLVNSKYDVEYNDKPLQSKHTSTCGKWCAYRMLRNKDTIEEFHDLFTDNPLQNDKMILKLFS